MMTSSKIKKVAFVACCFGVTVFCGCGDSTDEPKAQTMGSATNAVLAKSESATNSVLPANAATTGAVLPKSETAEKPKQAVEPEINGISMDGLRSLKLKASDTPDLEAFLDYVKIEPSPGPITVDYYS